MVTSFVLNPKSFTEECNKLKKFGVKVKIFNEANFNLVFKSSGEIE